MDKRVAFLGLGVMGYPMAGHLARAGHQVTVYNRTGSRAAKWVEEFGGAAQATPAAAVRDADIVMMCVGNDADVRTVATGADGALSGMRAGAILVDHTTASAQLARELDAAARVKHVGFIDAPVSGGQAGATNGTLTIMAGGDATAFARAEPVLGAYARAVTLLGPAGAGQLTKMVNQICVVGVIQSLAEGLNFAQRAGLDPLTVLDVIGKGAAQSWQMDNRGRTMVADQFDFGFAVDWMRKDLGICLAEARANGAALPVIALIDQFFARIQARGGGRWDNSSLIRLLRDPP
jgi:3-hydroxyisobutyrate dehydrogenase-like beta-hydroxyacid dehydrogenase